jgi:hypothetical protein
MRNLKQILVWLGFRCINLRLQLGVDAVTWLFSLSAALRAA